MKKKVEVYWNLHKHTWSVRKAHGRVLSHTDYIVVSDVQWVVQKAGQLRVLKEGKKNVHAFGRGYIGVALPQYVKNIHIVTYNPYKYDTFVKADSKVPIFWSEFAVFSIDPDGKPKVTSCREVGGKYDIPYADCA